MIKRYEDIHHPKPLTCSIYSQPSRTILVHACRQIYIQIYVVYKMYYMLIELFILLWRLPYVIYDLQVHRHWCVLAAQTVAYQPRNDTIHNRRYVWPKRQLIVYRIHTIRKRYGLRYGVFSFKQNFYANFHNMERDNEMRMIEE